MYQVMYQVGLVAMQQAYNNREDSFLYPCQPGPINDMSPWGHHAPWSSAISTHRQYGVCFVRHPQLESIFILPMPGLELGTVHSERV